MFEGALNVGVAVLLTVVYCNVGIASYFGPATKISCHQDHYSNTSSVTGVPVSTVWSCPALAVGGITDGACGGLTVISTVSVLVKLASSVTVKPN